MKKLLLLLIIPFLSFGQGKESYYENLILEKTKFYSQDLEVLSLSSIDGPPFFKDCQSFKSNQEKQKCFQNGVANHILRNFQYPAIAKEKRIEEDILVNFQISKKGSVDNVKVVKGENKHLKNEAIRLISSIPKLEPAVNDGKAVRCSFTVPISFTLKQSKSTEGQGSKQEKNTMTPKQIITEKSKVINSSSINNMAVLHAYMKRSAAYQKTGEFSKANSDLDKIINSEFYTVGLTLGNNNDTMIIKSIFNGSPAEKAGLKIGDKLIAIDNQSITGNNVKLWEKQILFLKRNEKKKLTIIRNLSINDVVEKEFLIHCESLPVSNQLRYDVLTRIAGNDISLGGKKRKQKAYKGILKAIKLEKKHSLDPSVYLYAKLSWLNLYFKKDYDNALINSLNCLKIRSDYYYAYYLLAQIYEMQGEIEDAIRNYNNYIRLEKNNPYLIRAYFLRANIKKKLGDDTFCDDLKYACELGNTIDSKSNFVKTSQNACEALQKWCK